MRTLLSIMMAFVVSFSVYAQDINTMKEVKPLITIFNRTTNPLLGTVNISSTDLILPWTFSVPAPSEDVAEVYGPTGPNTAYWRVQNGYLYITITEDAAPEIYVGESFDFIVRTTNSNFYTIKLNVL